MTGRGRLTRAWHCAVKMANLAIAPLVNAKVYRHFAAVTFAITLCVAMFANGQARQVVDEGLADRRDEMRLSEANTKKFGVKQIGDRRSVIGTRGGFGGDYDPSYGDSSGFSGSRPDTYGGGHLNDADTAASGPIDSAQPQILTPDEVAALSAAEQSAYLKRIRSSAVPARKEEVHDLAAIEAGSRARSGAAGND